MKQLKNEQIDAILVLPENFTEVIKNYSNPEIDYHVDGSDLKAVTSIDVALNEPISYLRVQSKLLINFTTMVPYLEFNVPSWESQVLNYALPMILPMIILGLMINLCALSIVSEGPLPRMLLTPTGKREIIFSKLIAYSIVMTLQVTEIFVLTSIFGMYSLGSLLDLYFVLLFIGFVGVSMGLFISALSKTEQQANQLFIMFFIVIVMFSGSFISIDRLPGVMKTIINFLPLGHAIPMITDITLKGLPMDGGDAIVLLLIGIVFLILANIVYRFKKVEV